MPWDVISSDQTNTPLPEGSQLTIVTGSEGAGEERRATNAGREGISHVVPPRSIQGPDALHCDPEAPGRGGLMRIVDRWPPHQDTTGSRTARRLQ